MAKPRPMYTDDTAPNLARLSFQVDPGQLGRLEAVAALRYGANKNVALRAALLVGLRVLEDRATLGLDPEEALAAYCRRPTS